MKTVLDIHGLSKNFDKQAILQDLHPRPIHKVLPW